MPSRRGREAAGLDVSPERTAPEALGDSFAEVEDGPRPEETDPLGLPRWLTERARRQRARRADERVPAEVYFPALGAFFSDGWIKDVLLLVKSGKEATLPRPDAGALFWRVIENLALWLRCGLVHADLSAYNLLYWRGGITAIDFPQAVDAAANPHAFDFLLRDVTNVCRHFTRYGVSVEPEPLAWDLWQGG